LGVHRSDAGSYPLAVLAFGDRPVELEIVQYSDAIRVVRAVEMPMFERHLDPLHIELAEDLNPSDASEAVRLDTVTALPGRHHRPNDETG
jgi:hypothetical protein